MRMREIVEGGNSLEGIYFRFANDITLDGVVGNPQEPGGVGTTKNSFVSRNKKERIGRILVDIYETAGKKAGEVAAHMETTMAE